MAPSPHVAMIHVSVEQLTQFTVQLLESLDVPSGDAAITAQVLVQADMTGRHTHGVNRLPLYVARLRGGGIESRPDIRTQSAMFPALLSVDGGNGLGPVVAWRAVEEAVRLSEQYGVGMVAVKRSNHAGALSVYCEEGARQGHIVMALTNSTPAIPPWGGRLPFFGTNPIAYGIPRGPNTPPLVVDLATSVVARGHIIEAARLRQPIPEGWAIDEQGSPTTDPEAALSGAVLPMAGPKGYALALIVEILSGVLTGAGVGTGVKNPYNDFHGEANVGHFFWAFNPKGFGYLETFYERLTAMEEAIHNVPTMPNRTIRLPGDRGWDKRQRAYHEGISMDLALFRELNGLATEQGLPLLSPC